LIGGIIIMKKMNLKLMVAALATVTAMGLFAGCAKDNTSSAAPSPSAAALSGSVKASGSTALQPLVDAIGKDFVKANPNVTVDVQGGGSGAGLTAVSDKTVDLGMSDVKAEEKITDAAKAKALVNHVICYQAFAIVVSKDVTLTDLTKAQIQDIFTGKVTNWKEVGGNDEAITVINRTKTSGTRATFKKTVMDGKDEKDGLGITQDASGGVKTAMETTKGAISYLAMSYLIDPATRQNLNLVKIGGVEANKENIISKKYVFAGDGNVYTNGEATGVVKAFIDYMTTAAGKAEMDKLGYYPAQ
jgi:phosphate transport system substrate-binding protein